MDESNFTDDLGDFFEEDDDFLDEDDFFEEDDDFLDEDDFFEEDDNFLDEDDFFDDFFEEDDDFLDEDGFSIKSGSSRTRVSGNLFDDSFTDNGTGVAVFDLDFNDNDDLLF
jgi:hypothetical protein